MLKVIRNSWAIFVLGFLMNASGATGPTIRHAKNFEITDYETHRILSVTNAFRDSTRIYHYALVPKGNELPDLPESVTVIRTPVERVVAMETVFIGYLEALGANVVRLEKKPVRDFVNEDRLLQSGRFAAFARDLERKEDRLDFGAGRRARGAGRDEHRDRERDRECDRRNGARGRKDTRRHVHGAAPGGNRGLDAGEREPVLGAALTMTGHL